jgi:hypothetical protein
MPYRRPPEIFDPAVIVTTDGMFFICWVEQLADQRRWIFVSARRQRYVGPEYRGEDSLDEIKLLVNEWWQLENELA